MQGTCKRIRGLRSLLLSPNLSSGERDPLADKLTASGTAATPGPQPADAGDTSSIASGS